MGYLCAYLTLLLLLLLVWWLSLLLLLLQVTLAALSESCDWLADVLAKAAAAAAPGECMNVHGRSAPAGS
jgi:hypothetical protein